MHVSHPIRSERGYTLIDVMVVVLLIGILGSMAVFQIGSVRPGMQTDGAMRVLMAELISAREMAITQRRFMQVEFVGVDTIRVTRIEVPAGATVLRTVSFEAGVQYEQVGGIADTPDAFGAASAIDFGDATTIMFGTDGSLIDNTGAPLNGSVFLMIPNTPQSQRAVTIQGSTGRIRGYRWFGDQWQQV